MTDESQVEIENIRGFRTIDVRLVDGTREKVNVKKLNVYELTTWGTVMGNQGKLAELFTGKDEEWVAKVDYDGPNGIEGILNVGEEINFPTLVRFAEKDSKLTGKILELLQSQTEGRKALRDISASLAASSKSPSS